MTPIVHRRGRRRFGVPERSAAVAALMAVVSLALAMPTAPAAAQSVTPADPVASATARPLFVGIGLGFGGLLSLGAPLARSRLNASPPSAQAAAGVVDIRQSSEDQAIVPGIGLVVTASNPGQGGTTLVPLGALGPHATAETPSPRMARGQAGLTGPALQGLLSVEASTEARFSASGDVLVRAVSEIPSLALLDLEIRGLRSEIRIEAGAASPPLVSYSLTILGLRVAGSQGAGAGGIVVGANRVPLSAVAERFGQDVAPVVVALGSLRLEHRLRLLQPSVTTSADGHATVRGPIVEIALSLGGEHPLLTLGLGSVVASVALPSAGTSPDRSRSASSRTRPSARSEAAPGPGPSSPGSPPLPDLGAPSSPPASSDTGTNAHPGGRRGRGSTPGTTSRLVPVVLAAAAALNASLLLGQAAARMARSRANATR